MTSSKQAVYVVTGATGHVGNVLAQKLLALGRTVRVIGRSSERLEPLAAQGAEPFVGSLEDVEFLKRAFAGATALFAMVPPHLTTPDYRAYQNRISAALAAATSAAGLTHVVTLSSLGAHLPSGTGHIAGLHEMEQRFNQLSNVNIVHLRPAYFMENQYMSIDPIKHMGANVGTLKADLPVPLIATRDIAEAAARLLGDLNFTGTAAKELLGPRDYTMNEVTRILGEAIGKPDLKYMQISYDEARKAMLEAGLSPSAADGVIEIDRAMNEGRLRPVEARSPQNTTPTTLEEFAASFAAAYRGSSAATA
jgi:uncharacterized protein YbjT (DUF2867 family)